MWCAQHDPTPCYPPRAVPTSCRHIQPTGYFDTVVSDVARRSLRPKLSMPWNMRGISGEDRNRGKKPEFVCNDRGSRIDEVVVDCDSSRMWGRFIQLGGDVAARVYPDFRASEGARPRTLSVGVTPLRYELWRNAAESYDAARAHRPIYSIYDDTRPHHLFQIPLQAFPTLNRWPTASAAICSHRRSSAARRIRYRYLGTWPDFILKGQYPEWHARMEKEIW